MLPPQAPGRGLPPLPALGPQASLGWWPHPSRVCLRLHVASPLGLCLLFCLFSGHCHWTQGHPYPGRPPVRSLTHSTCKGPCSDRCRSLVPRIQHVLGWALRNPQEQRPRVTRMLGEKPEASLQLADVASCSGLNQAGGDSATGELWAPLHVWAPRAPLQDTPSVSLSLIHI